MEHKTRIIIRWIIFTICLVAIIYFQRTTGVKELGLMFVALLGLLGVLYDYNRDYTHPKRD
ncbi:hypothetical protein I4Q36_08960 [Tuanshanicoccus lijuaniae]|uniref:DUF6903 family protein n=1 Tax=Aerococcaceae bacterium zg-1292 TaxID=2774330 RepID=UPI001937C89A|nr:hypothetical protein [Aerococcaceae bacterium zg-1292]MBF6626595.1 hypothetical protein [Aerococcaceae bacterium zg-BR9]MBF6978960.1 hypothetical protein [Aerococcaceae bacterium zg-BR22]MBS4455394.1 hypothetical protein [Aerococcaceae bacterium zg-A91]MBS4457354.1 hypothetical protein [Aerococcaceae bacterium zg-BR33]